MKKVLKAILFISILLLLGSFLGRLLTPKTSEMSMASARINEFYALPRNSVDVLFFGASTFYQGIIPLEIWQDYGFTTFLRVNSAQAAMISYYYLVESLEYQKPKVVVIDTASIFSDYNFQDKEGKVRTAVDPMRLTFTKLQLIRSIIAYDPSQSFVSYLFPLLRYHSRWSELTKEDFSIQRPASNMQKGYYGFRYESKVEYPPHTVEAAGLIRSFSEDMLSYIEKMIRLCAENDIEVVFLTMPRDDWNAEKYASMQKLADEQGVQYFDYNLEQNASAIRLEACDLFNSSHLNTLGAQKVSHHFGAWLQERYLLPDHRSDPAFAQWNEDLQQYEKELLLSLRTKKD